jgi:hypothetical protein
MVAGVLNFKEEEFFELENEGEREVVEVDFSKKGKSKMQNEK